MSLPSIETKNRSAKRVAGEVFIREFVLNAAVNNFTINNIPQIYRHLKVYTSFRSAATGSPNCTFTLNNDASALYNYQEVRGNASTTSSTRTSDSTFGYYGILTSSASTANFFSRGVILFHYYRDRTQVKSWFLKSGFSIPGGGQSVNHDFVGDYNSLNSINSITFIHDLGSNNFAVGSKVTLYGVY